MFCLLHYSLHRCAVCVCCLFEGRYFSLAIRLNDKDEEFINANLFRGRTSRMRGLLIYLRSVTGKHRLCTHTHSCVGRSVEVSIFLVFVSRETKFSNFGSFWIFSRVLKGLNICNVHEQFFSILFYLNAMNDSKIEYKSEVRRQKELSF